MNSEPITRVKPVFIVLFLACILGLGVREAIAQEASDHSLVSQTRPRRVKAQLDIESRAEYPLAARPSETIVIAYAAYAEAFRVEPAATTRQPFSLTSATTAKPTTIPVAGRNLLPSLAPAPAASTAPMSVGEKFHGWYKRFWSPGSYFGAIAKGMYGELQDNDDFKKDTFKNYVADSGTRAARSFASSTAYGFYEKALLASIFKQDPRYHRSDKTGAGAKLLYAVSRLVVTQGDTCGCDQFNASLLLGGALGAVTANVWERSERTGPVHTTSRFLNHLMFKALGNIMREFLSGQ